MGSEMCIRDRYAYRRTLGDEQAFVILNFSNQEVPFWSPDEINLDRYKILLCNEELPQNNNEALRPYEARVYYYKEDGDQ